MPQSWNGEGARLLTAAYFTILDKIREFGFEQWHHASRDALPLSIIDYNISIDLKPTSFESLMSIAAIESILSRTA